MTNMPWGWSLLRFLSFWLVRKLPSPCVLKWLFLCTYPSLISLPLKDTSPNGLRSYNYGFPKGLMLTIVISACRVQCIYFMEKEMATHPSILAWRIPWKEEPGRLQSMGSQRVEYD